MKWIWIVALVPPILYGISNLIDKVIVHGDNVDNNSWAMIALGTVFDLVIIVPLGIYSWIVNGHILPSAGQFIPLFLNGSTFTVAAWLFYESIKREDTSKAVSILQIIPAFGILLSFYGLNEKMGLDILLAIILLTVGGFVVSITKGKINKGMLVAMLLSAALYAVNDYVVAKFGREVLTVTDCGFFCSIKEVMPVILADLFGKLFFGLISLLGRKQRTSFILGFKTKLKLVALGSVVYGAGDVVYDIAKIFAPLALVQALGCTQPVFVLIGAVALSFFYKNFPQEEVDGKSLFRKSFGVVMMVAGGILLVI